MEVGARVLVEDVGEGVVQYLGEPAFARGSAKLKGVWIGVELDEPNGKNDGSAKGTRYFTCKPGFGLFIKRDSPKVHVIGADGTPAASTSPTKKKKIVKGAKKATTTKKVTKKAGSPTKKVAKAGSKTTLKKTTKKKKSTATLEPDEPIEPEPTVAAFEEEEEAGESKASALKALIAEHSKPRALIGEDPTPAHTLPDVPDMASGFDDDSVHVSMEDLSVKPDDGAVVKLLKEQLRAMLTQKTKWLEIERALKEQIVGLQKESLDFKLQVDELEDTTELAVLDKECCDEKIAILEDEIAQVTAHNNGLLSQLSVLSTESFNAEVSPEDIIGSPAYQTLLGENQRMKDALLKLKFYADDANDALMDGRVGFRDTRKTLLTTRVAVEEKTHQFANASEELERLREEVGSIVALQDKLDELGEANLDLEKRNRELEEELMCLEDLAEVEFEIEEVLEDITGETQSEIELEKRRFGALQEETDESRKAVGSLEDKVKKLGAEIRRLEAIEIEFNRLNAAAEDGDGSKPVSHGVRIKQLTQQREKLLVGETNLHVSLLKNFLPQSFFDEDYDSIKLFLLLSRLASKSALMVSYIRAEFRLDADYEKLLKSRTVTSLQLGFATRLCQLLLSIQDDANAFVKTLEAADPQHYRSFGHFFPELSKHEAALNTLMDLIVHDNLSPAASLDGLRTLSVQLGKAAEQEVRVKTRQSCQAVMTESLNATSAASEVLCAELKGMETAIPQAVVPDADAVGDKSEDENEGEAAPAAAPGGAGSLFAAALHALYTKASAIKSACKKARKRMPHTPGITVGFDDGLRASLQRERAAVVEIARRFSNAAADVQREREGGKVMAASSIEKNIVTQNVGVIDTGAAPELDSDLKAHLNVHGLMSQSITLLEELVGRMEEGELDRAINDSDIFSGEAPWTSRGKDLVSAYTEALRLEPELNRQQQLARDLKAQVKTKDKELAVKKLMLSSAKKQVEHQREDAAKLIPTWQDKVHKLERELEDMEKMFKSTEAALQEDVQVLSAEKHDAEKRLALFKRQVENKAARTRSGEAYYLGKIEMLKRALGTARGDNARLRGAAMRQQLTTLPHSGRKAASTEEAPAVSTKLSNSTDKLLRVLKLESSAPMVVDLAKAAKGTAPPAASQLASQLAHVQHLRREGLSVIEECKSVIAGETSDRNASFGTFFSDSYLRVLQERKTCPHVANIRVPAIAGYGGARSLVVDPRQFESIHALLAS